ncbi:MAG: sugar transferase [Pseudomonadota bacterium]
MTAQVEVLEQSTSLDATAPFDHVDRGSVYRAFGKRVLDVALIVATLPVWFPLVALITALLVIFGHSPFYTQERLGMGGRVFWMFKFRTMVPNAERVLAEYLEANADTRVEWQVHQKLKKDPRITPLGHFLRKTSLDELPQIFNVLSGDMSLVGPRPMMVEQRTMYPGTAYYSLRPGITGPWQVSDRNGCAFRDRAKFDADYAHDLSLTRDLGLLFGTLGVVLKGTGY